MARRPRLQLPGAIYHVMSRGNRKATIFEDDEDRRQFLTLLEAIHQRYEVSCYAVCLMRNHYHLVVETPRVNLADAMAYVNGVYTQRSNRHHARSGHLLEGRYRAIIVQRLDYLRHVVRYVVLNPVRAGLVERAEQWQWNSHRATAGLAPAPSWLSTDWLPAAFGARSLRHARRRYCEFVDTPAEQLAMDWHQVAIGSPEFEAALALTAKLCRRNGSPKPAAPPARPSLAELFAGVDTREERNRLVEIAHLSHGYRLAEIARHLKHHHSTISQIVRRALRRRRA